MIALPTDMVSEFLDTLQIDTNCYDLGTFLQRITVIDQQIRAFNLAYSLEKNHIINNKSSIGVVGGGIGGVTISTALIEKGFHVTIYEKEEIFFNLQLGCQIRELHPNIYNWPNEKSLYPYAEIPLMSWSKGSANSVVNSLYKKFISQTFNKNTLIKKLGNDVSSVCKNIKNNKWTIESMNSGVLESSEFDVVIIASGFGVEINKLPEAQHKHISEYLHFITSYWRNDELSQTNISSNDHNYLISGIGDGAITDICRILFFNYSPLTIIQKIEKSSSWPILKTELQNIKKIYYTNKLTSKFIYDEFNRLHETELLNDIYLILSRSNLKKRNNNLILNVRSSNFSSCFDLSKKSLYNALMLFCIKKLHLIKHFIQGEIEFKSSSGKKFIGVTDDQGKSKNIAIKEVKFLLRHGTNPSETLKKLSIQSDLIDLHKTKQLAYSTSREETRLWEVGWFSSLAGITDYKPKIEYYSPDTSLLVFTFISSISNLIKKFHNNNQFFRVTLHRYLEVKGQPFYQQLCEYAGTEISSKKAGRVFPLQVGVAGFSFRYGKAALIEKMEETCWTSLWSTLNMPLSPTEPLRIMRPTVSSILTLPIQVQCGQNLSTNLVLYLDSDLPNFFSQNIEGNLVEILVNTTEGFLNGINYLISQSEIISMDTSFDLFMNLKEDDYFDQIINNDCFNLDYVSNNIEPILQSLKNDNFCSFDLITNKA